jgi:DNA gyrase inhibitor GyrI
MKMWIILSVAIVFVLCVVLVGCKFTRGGYESAAYTVVRTDGKFQVRDYPALRVAETITTDPEKGEDGSFGRLFRFITGGNKEEQKIAMTTPVFMSTTGTNRTMAFVMPTTFESGQVPEPSDEAVTLRELPAGRFAVLRYGGGRKATREAAVLEKLEAWIRAEGLSAESSPIYGYFDPPWTPAFLRRNEVMLQIEPIP